MMDARRIAGKLALLALCATSAQGAPPAKSAAPRGRLVVFLVVDQLRYQDVLWLRNEWGPKGFAGLGQPAPMRYATAVTETAADHAVLSTGTYADLNGIVANRYVENNRSHEMVEDPACPVWGAPGVGKSSALLRVPNVVDALKLGTNGRARAVSVAIKDRAALFLGGAAADVAVWLEVETGRMASTACYAKEAPPWLAQLNAQHPLSELKDWVWTLDEPGVVDRYAPQEQTPGAMPKNDIGPAFPHRVGKGKAGKALALAIRESPAATEIALRTARAALAALQLGNGEEADYLQISLPSVDYAGHQFGTVSRERVDALLRMHAQLAAFVEELRGRYGPRVSFALTADHGLTAIATDQERLRVRGGGTLDIDELVAKVNQALDQAFPPRPEGWVVALDGNSLWLRRPFPPRAVQVAAEVLRREPGMFAVSSADDPSAMPEVRHAFFPGRSGELILVPRPLWTLKKAKDGADHGTPWNDDALVPLFVSAPGVKLRRTGTLRATQVAPTAAALLQVSPPAAALDDPAIETE